MYREANLNLDNWKDLRPGEMQRYSKLVLTCQMNNVSFSLERTEYLSNLHEVTFTWLWTGGNLSTDNMEYARRDNEKDSS